MKCPLTRYLCALIAIVFLSGSAYGGFGYWDLFSVTLTPQGPYWAQVNGGTGVLADPLESPDCAGVAVIDSTTPLGGQGWFFGGYDWGTGTLEGNAGQYKVMLKGASSYTVNVILDTKTTPASNGLFGSWGTVSNIKVRPWTGAGWGAPIPVAWVISPFSPAGGTVVNQFAGGTITDIKLGVLDFGDTEGNGQAQGIYGASATLPYAAGYCVEFVTDLKTWDSYNLSTTIPNAAPTGDCNCIDEGQLPEIKWSQKPDLSFWGFDVDSTNYILADDFECNSPEPITDIHIYGSWKDDILPFGMDEPNMGNPAAVIFTLSIHSDNPMGSMGWSEPNQLLWMKTFGPGEFSVEPYYGYEYNYEGWYDPETEEYIEYCDKLCWKYNFYMNKNDIFWQQGDPCNPIIYWLNVKAEPNDPNAVFGWKTSIEHWNDDAVWGDGNEPYTGTWHELIYPFGHPYHPNSVDLAFDITTTGDPCEPNPVADLGDAPDSTNTSIGVTMTAYPGVNANFPTVYVVGSPPPGPIHWQPMALAYLGPTVSLELEADIFPPDQDGVSNIDPLTDTADQDSQPAGGDDGVMNMPLNLPYCKYTTFDYQVNVVNPAFQTIYVNAWFDWNRDGDYDDTVTCGTASVPEWAVQNQLLFNLPIGLTQITSPAFLCWNPNPGTDEDIWMRITLAEKPWKGGNFPTMVGNGGSGPIGGYNYGETEDYFFTADTSCQACPDLTCDGYVDLFDLAVFANKWLQNCP
jgi:hypothetical protein